MMAERLNLSFITRTLSAEGLDPPGELAWLEDSYREPENFWPALKRLQDSSLPWPTKSIPFEQYDFYQDIIIRNQENPAPAFRWFDPVSGRQESSYSELGALATQKEPVWLQSGVQPGQTVCIILPLGLEFVVSLLTALKIGLTISCLPPQRYIFLQNRLQTLSPEHIVTDELYFPLLSAWREHILPQTASAQSAVTNPQNSYAYPTGAVIGLCFDPSSESPHIPQELTSDAAYLCPLRDGILALGLQPGDVMAAPGFHFLESQPGLLLAVLLNGATWLHLEPDDIADRPQLLTEHSIQIMGISKQVRDALIRKPVTPIAPWNYWFRNPAESQDIEQWQSFIQTLGLENVYSGNLRYHTASGGCALFSVRRRGKAHLNVLPSAGVPWELTDVAGNDVESQGNYGLFSPATLGRQDGEKTATTSILAQSQKEWLFVGSRLAGRGGRVYPRAEILNTVQGVGSGSLYSIVQTPPFGGAGDPGFILLVFTGGKPADSFVGLTSEILDVIEKQLGKEFLPDRIRLFPLYPRRDADGNVDHNWCRDQYLTGGLFRKSRQETYRCLALLRECLA